MEPRFPLLCHDHYTIEGYFKSMGSMAELESVLAAEQVEITLWQNGRRMAHFMGKLSDVMQPSLPKLCCEHNVNVQLLMKPSPAFPGIIAPKVELTAQVDVKDRLTGSAQRLGSSLASSQKCGNNYHGSNASSASVQRYHENCQRSMPKNSECSQLNWKRRQQPVCHAQDINNTLQAYTEKHYSNTNEQRRPSACSSLLSNVSYPCSQSTAASSSKCSHSHDSNASIHPDEHQQRCTICQKYKKIFQVPTKYSQ